MQNNITLGDIFREYGEDYINRRNLSGQEKGIISLLSACRTAALGSHFEKCPECSYFNKAYNPVEGISRKILRFPSKSF